MIIECARPREFYFPAIKSTDNKVEQAYSSSNTQDCRLHPRPCRRHLHLSFYRSPYARALIVQEDVCAALNELTPSAFQTELRECLVYYYEKVCLMADADGLSSVRTKKRKFKKHKPTAPGLDDGPGDALLEGLPW